MNTKRTPALMLAGCQALFLGGMLSLTVADTEAAGMSTGTRQTYPPGLAQMESVPGQRPGGYGMGPGSYGTGPGGFGMRPGQGQGPGSFGMAPAQGPDGYGMSPGQGPGGYGMGPGQGPGGYGMGQPPAGGAQSMGPGFGGAGYGMPPGGQQPGMMVGAMGGPGSAMLNTIGAMDLTNEQRSQFNAISGQLQARQQELMDKLRADGEKMRKLQEEQMRLGQTLTDLQGHLMQATMDAANRAEELLTEDQRQAMIDQGRHVMMRPGRTTGYGQRRGESE